MWVLNHGDWRPTSPERESEIGDVGEMASRCRAFPWSTSALGARERWTASLSASTSLILATPVPMMLLWGPALTQIYNDGFRDFLGDKHPVALGLGARECWPEAWPFNARSYQRVLAGETVVFRDVVHPSASENPVEPRCTLTHSPIVESESALVTGILVTVSTESAGCRMQHAVSDRPFMVAESVDRSSVLAALLASMSSGVMVGTLDKVSLANLEALRQLGCSSIEEASHALGTLAERLRIRDAATGLPILQHDLPFVRALRDGRRHDRDVRIRDQQTGVDRVVHCSALPITDANGTVTSAVAVQTDVTQRLQLEAQLREAHKMEAVGRLAGGVAHDFNNVLTAVIGNVQFALEGMTPSDAAREPLSDVLGAANRATILTRQLLAFGRRQTLRPQLVDLARAANDVSRMLRRVLGEHIELHTASSIPGGDTSLRCTVRVDPGQLDQVLVNLALNARDAMPEGGNLTIVVSCLDVVGSNDVVPWYVRPGLYCLLTVQDTGTGIAPDVLPHVFDPFFTTKGIDQGTGLGLSTVYGIIKQSDGYVWADSEEGRGTTMSVLLPRRADEVPSGRTTPARGAVSQGEGVVLLVEDEPDVRRLYRRVLERAGYSVLEAPDGEDALAQFATNTIDFVVSDIVMPRLGGVELARRVLETSPDTPVILMSGHPGEALPGLSTLGQHITFLQKPFGPAVLLGAIEAQRFARATPVRADVPRSP